MTTTEHTGASLEQEVDKGLKSGALGLFSTTIIATASVAPARRVLGYFYCKVINPAFFKKQTLTRATPTLVPDE